MPAVFSRTPPHQWASTYRAYSSTDQSQHRDAGDDEGRRRDAAESERLLEHKSADQRAKDHAGLAQGDDWSERKGLGRREKGQITENRHSSRKKADGAMPSNIRQNIRAPCSQAIGGHTASGDDLQASLEAQDRACRAHAQPAKEAVGGNGHAGRARISDCDAAGAGPQRQDHYAERDQPDGREVGGVESFAQGNERRDRHQYRSDAARERIDHAHVAEAIGPDEQCVVTELNDSREYQPLPALRPRPIDERKGRKPEHKAGKADRDHREGAIAGRLHKRIPDGVSYCGEEHKPVENRRSHEPVASKFRTVANAVAHSVSFPSRT